MGTARWNPCPTLYPSDSSELHCSGRSMPSATIAERPRVLARSRMVRTSPDSLSLPGSVSTNSWASLSPFTGSICRYDSDE
jgi:hypothetical protein